MNTLAYFLIVVSAAWLLYVYIGYPVCLWFLSLFRSVPHVCDEAYTPSVSVLIAARNEEKDIGWKVRQTLGWDYPKDELEILIASDASDDRTDEILQSFADARVRYVRMEKRGGKVRALNHLARMARGELLFCTDANSSIEPGAIRRMVRHFADARVGCVTGADRTALDETEKVIGAGEKAYWTYELTIDRLESRLGSVLVCFGAVHCIRRSLYGECDPDLANDLEVPMRIGDSGHLLLFEPDAVSTERATESSVEEFNRRRRICGQGALGYVRLFNIINGLRAWQFVSRKVLRWCAAVPLLAFLCGSLLIAIQQPWAMLLITVQFGCYLAAGVGWVIATRKSRSRRIFAIPFYFCLVNVAALMGVIDACCGRRYATWGSASHTRGHAAGAASRAA